MARRLAQVQLVVPDYDAAIAFYCEVLGFRCVADQEIGPDGKRWVVISPGDGGAALVLGRADTPQQVAAIGNQAGGRVFLFLETDDFARDHALYRSKGVGFLEDPRHEPYGTVAVFEDGFGNRWDLIEPARDAS